MDQEDEEYDCRTLDKVMDVRFLATPYKFYLGKSLTAFPYVNGPGMVSEYK